MKRNRTWMSMAGVLSTASVLTIMAGATGANAAAVQPVTITVSCNGK